MQSVVLFFCALVIVMNFIVDIAYLLIDPRLRAGAR
jgi:peptide/nickel transport system permease protein